MWADILAFVGGVWLLQQQPSLPGLFWSWLLLPLLLLLYGLRQRGSRPLKGFIRVIRILFWLHAGFLWAAALAHLRLADGLPGEWEGRDMQLTGVVAGMPVSNERGLRFEFDVERVATVGARVPAHIQLSWFDGGFGRPAVYPVPELHPGERWELTVRLKRPHGNINPFGFDYEAWLLERNIRATGYVREGATNRRVSERVYRPGYLVEVAREAASRRLSMVLGERPYAGVLKALAVGEQGAIAQDQWQVFLRTGVNHLMSISGVHVTMVSGMFFSLVYWLWRRSQVLTLRLPARKAAVVAGVLAALGYALLSGFGVPTQRTLYMLSVVAVALWLGWISSTFTVLSLALLLVLLLDPWAVTSSGFWLSFGAVAVILYVSAGRIGRSHWLAEWGRVQWAVTLGLVPLLLAMFQQVSIISPVANAIAIPVVSLVVTPLTLAGTALPLDFLLLSAHQVMAWCMALLRWLSALPAVVWQQHGPAFWAVLAALCGALWLLLPRGFPARWLGLVWFAPLFLVQPATPRQGELWVTALDVGQGLAAVVRTRHHALLYDAGPFYSMEADAGSRVVIPFLRGTGVAGLDGVVVSHDDIDHSGGAMSVLQGMPVGWTISSLPVGSPVIAGAANKLRCFAGQAWNWDGVHFEILHPTWDSYQDGSVRDNDRGCVLKVSSAFGSVLLPADIESISERNLLQRAAGALSADVLVVPHHGSGTSSTKEFIRAVNPTTAIITVGYRNRFGHPKAEVMQRYQEQAVALYRTDRDGALELQFTSGGMSLKTSREFRKRYWQADWTQ